MTWITEGNMQHKNPCHNCWIQSCSWVCPMFCHSTNIFPWFCSRLKMFFGVSKCFIPLYHHYDWVMIKWIMTSLIPIPCTASLQNKHIGNVCLPIVCQTLIQNSNQTGDIIPGIRTLSNFVVCTIHMFLLSLSNTILHSRMSMLSGLMKFSLKILSKLIL